MPAYDKPIEFRLQPRDNLQPRAVGAVIQFVSTDKQRIQQWLDAAMAKGIIAPATAREYNPDHGSPVWYIP